MMSWMLPSLKVPMAMKEDEKPACRVRVAGVTAMELRVAAVTVTEAVPEMVPEVAVMVAVPAPTAVTRPLASTVATAVLELLQTAVELRSWTLKSLKKPVAVICWVVLTPRVRGVGSTVMELSVAVVTVRSVEPLTPAVVAVIVAVPTATPVARPAGETVATAVLELVQATVLVRSSLLPSLKIPKAVIWTVKPAATAGRLGVTEMDTRVAFVTVKLAVPVIEAWVAVMLTVPGMRPVATPAASMVATVMSLLLQAAVLVRSRELPSLKIPVAVYGRVNPAASRALGEATEMETRVAAVTVRLAVPLMAPRVAVIVALPTVEVLARPPLLMVATLVALEFQVTEPVRFWVLPSLRLPVAMNCWLNPAATEAVEGDTVMEVRATTFTRAVPVRPDVAAVMVAVPAETAVTRPVLFTVVAAALELQTAVAVMFCVVPSLKAAVAVICWVVPAARLEVLGVTVMAVITGAVTVAAEVPLTLLWVAVMVALPMPAPVTSPVVLTVATPGALVDQTAVALTLEVVASLRVAVATSCWVRPLAMLKLAGVTAMDTMTGAVTAVAEVPLMVLWVAVMVALPMATPVTRPIVLTVATPGALVDQTAVALTLEVVASLRVAVATSCWVRPLAMLKLAGVTAMETMLAVETVADEVPLLPD